VVQEAFSQLGAIIKREPGPHDVANADETSVKPDVGGRKIVAGIQQKAVAAPYNSSIGHVTMMAAGTAAGDMMPPHLIFEGQRALSTYLDGAPGFTISMQEKGWMTAELFCEWMKKFAAWIGRPCILFLDWHASRNVLLTAHYARQHNIIPVMLPPNCTHKLQPADVAYFRPFKRRWQDVIQNMWPRVPVTKYNIASLIYKSLTTTSASEQDDAGVTAPGIYFSKNWTSGFKKCGIYPFNPHIITDADFAPSEKWHKQMADHSAAASLLALAAPAAVPALPAPALPALTGDMAQKMVDSALPARNLVDFNAKLEAYVKKQHKRTAVILTQQELLERELAEVEAKEAEAVTKVQQKAKKKADKAVRDAAAAKTKQEKEAARKQRDAARAAAREAAAAKAAAKEAAAAATALAAVGPPKTAKKGKKRKVVMLEESPAPAAPAEPRLSSSGRPIKQMRVE
jgi:hypothetical protein